MVRFPRCCREGMHALGLAVVVLTWFIAPAFAQAPQTNADQAPGDIKRAEKAAPFDARKLKGSVQNELGQARERLNQDGAKLPADITPQERESARKVRTVLVH